MQRRAQFLMYLDAEVQSIDWCVSTPDDLGADDVPEMFLDLSGEAEVTLSLSLFYLFTFLT